MCGKTTQQNHKSFLTMNAKQSKNFCLYRCSLGNLLCELCATIFRKARKVIINAMSSLCLFCQTFLAKFICIIVVDEMINVTRIQHQRKRKRYMRMDCMWIIYSQFGWIRNIAKYC